MRQLVQGPKTMRACFLAKQIYFHASDESRKMLFIGGAAACYKTRLYAGLGFLNRPFIYLLLDRASPWINLVLLGAGVVRTCNGFFKEFLMRLRFLKIFGVAAALAVASTFTAFASPDGTVTREVPASADIQRYFAAHGVDQTLDTMVVSALKNDIDPYADPASVSMVVGNHVFSLTGNDQLKTTDLNSSMPAQQNNG
jgi:hypothetical protein